MNLGSPLEEVHTFLGGNHRIAIEVGRALLELGEIFDALQGSLRAEQPLNIDAPQGGCLDAMTELLRPNVANQLQSRRFTSFAADTHLRYKQGSLPLAVVSEQPGAVSGWLQTQLPFHFSLPNYPSEAGEPKSYSLVGARLMRYDGRDVAYLAYTMDTRPISLLVASGASVIPSRGQTYASGKLVFHISAEQGLKLITWTDRGLSYAIVSDVQVGGAQSCIICHGSKVERQRFESLFPVARPHF